MEHNFTVKPLLSTNRHQPMLWYKSSGSGYSVGYKVYMYWNQKQQCCYEATTLILCSTLIYRVDADLQVKVADFGLTRDIYATDYYRQSHQGRVPIKWMSLESLHDKISNEKTDVVC